jgi:integrase
MILPLAVLIVLEIHSLQIRQLTMLIPYLLERINFRQINHKTEDCIYKYQRQNKATYHAFRKYFNTCLANCDVNVTIKEMLMGHSVGLDDT